MCEICEHFDGWTVGDALNRRAAAKWERVEENLEDDEEPSV
jgi:hypothetical protein